MALEMLSEYMVRMEGGPVDIHTHPRKFDVLTDDIIPGSQNGREGKAGLAAYTQVALESGIVAMIAMSNESIRLVDPTDPSDTRTLTLPYSIANLDRLRASQSLTSHEAYIPTADYLGLDPEDMFLDDDKQIINEYKLYTIFDDAKDDCVGLKIYGDETTGGYNIDIKHIPSVVRLFYATNPAKPIAIHLENENVGIVLHDIYKLPKGKDIPVHIPHVSSREELEAVIEAKKAGMNVTCEATPHHLFLDDTAIAELGGYGCVKPTIKTRNDIEFLRANFKEWVDGYASDCAPHRKIDKEAGAYGMTNHTVMLPLAFGAAELEKEKYQDEADRWITLKDIYQKMCVFPRKRFNLAESGSFLDFDINPESRIPLVARESHARYGHNPFMKLPSEGYPLVGRVVNASAGKSRVVNGKAKLQTSYSHLMRAV